MQIKWDILISLVSKGKNLQHSKEEKMKRVSSQRKTQSVEISANSTKKDQQASGNIKDVLKAESKTSKIKRDTREIMKEIMTLNKNTPDFQQLNKINKTVTDDTKRQQKHESYNNN